MSDLPLHFVMNLFVHNANPNAPFTNFLHITKFEFMGKTGYQFSLH